jgi:hypothetical protein
MAQYGAGLHLDRCAATLSHCTFAENLGRWGSGCHTFAGSVTFNACEFLRGAGGPSEIGDGLILAAGTHYLNRCEFVGCDAYEYGAALDVTFSAHVEVSRCNFHDNVTHSVPVPSASAIFASLDAAVFVYGSEFSGNTRPVTDTESDGKIIIME